MKKLIWIILLMIPICHVKAEVYYSDYTDWKKVEEIPSLSTDLFEVKEEKEYLWYQLERVGEYFKKAEDHSSFPYETDFWKYGNWSNWTSDKIEASDEIEVEMRKVYDYQIMKMIRFIKLSNFSASQMTIRDVSIYNKNQEISFEESKIEDGYIYALSEPCYVDELEISFTLIDHTNLEKNFTIEWMYDLDTVSMYEQPRLWFQGSLKQSYYYRNMLERNILWDPQINQSLEKMENKIHQMVWEREEYRYREKLHYYEKEMKKYAPDYQAFSIPGFPYKDESTVRTTLKVRTREKINQDFSFITDEMHHLLEKQMIEIKEMFLLFAQSQNEKLEELIRQNMEKRLKEQLTEFISILKEENLKIRESIDLIVDFNSQNISELEKEVQNIYQKIMLEQEKYNQDQIKVFEKIKKIVSTLDENEKEVGEEILSKIERLKEYQKENIKNILQNLSDTLVDQKLTNLKKEQSENLSKQFDEIKATLMSFQNSQSEQEIKRQVVPIKKQATSFPILIFLFLIGILIGRIVTMKKKF